MADMALAQMLAFWCNRDLDQMDKLFRDSALYREKWDELRGKFTYGERTLRTAVCRCTEVYTPAKAETQPGGKVQQAKVAECVIASFGKENILEALGGT